MITVPRGIITGEDLEAAVQYLKPKYLRLRHEEIEENRLYLGPELISTGPKGPHLIIDTSPTEEVVRDAMKGEGLKASAYLETYLAAKNHSYRGSFPSALREKEPILGAYDSFLRIINGEREITTEL